MRIDSVKRLRVAVVPSWLAELVTVSPDLSFSDLLNFSELADRKSSILSKDEVIIYGVTQRYLGTFTEDVFSDMIQLANTEENQGFYRDNEEAFTKVEKDTLLKDQLTKTKGQGGLFTNPDAILGKEHYVPLMLNTDTLLLIGNKSGVYENKRAFYNAVIETVAGKVPFADFREYNFFKHYLRHAIDA